MFARAKHQIQMAFPSKAPDTPPSFQLSRRSARISELQRLRIQSGSAAEWFFPPPPGRERLPTATNVNGRASAVRSFPSAIKQQQGEAAAFPRTHPGRHIRPPVGLVMQLTANCEGFLLPADSHWLNSNSSGESSRAFSCTCAARGAEPWVSVPLHHFLFAGAAGDALGCSAAASWRGAS